MGFWLRFHLTHSLKSLGETEAAYNREKKLQLQSESAQEVGVFI